MSSPFLAEIRVFPFNFAPKGWALCNGQIMPLSQNTALFSLLGTTYGGDGKTTFALPNLQGSAAMHPGQGPGLSLHDLGEQSGTPYVTLLTSEMPAHSHTISGDPLGTNAKQSSPQNNVPSNFAGLTQYSDGTANTTMSPLMASIAGGSQPHNNMMPYLTLNYCIALQGIYPARP